MPGCCENCARAPLIVVDEAAWAELHSTKSRPFDRPDTGKIAGKVRNHYRDGVLKGFALLHWKQAKLGERE